MTDESTTDGSGIPEEPQPDLLRGWDWGSLLIPVIEDHVPDGFNAEEYAASINKEMEPLLEQIDKVLENRPNEATLDERVLALEKKILMLRQAHELLLVLAIHRTELIGKARARKRSSASSSARARVDPDPSVAEAAQQKARRLRLLGQ